MPQLDLESLFCVGSGQSRSKVACETIALPCSDPGGQCSNTAYAHADDAGGGAELRRIQTWDGISWAWSGRPGVALERNGSTKGTSNPKASAAGARKGAAASRSSRLPAGKTAVVIAVLAAGGKLVLEERRFPVNGRGWRRPAAGARVFASEATEAEPVSPKVSCFGAVRSESRAAATTPPSPWEEEQVEGWRGCWASVTAALHHLCASNNRCEGELGASELKDTASEPPTVAVLSPPRPVLGLGDVKHLASRRWPEGLAGEGRGSV